MPLSNPHGNKQATNLPCKWLLSSPEPVLPPHAVGSSVNSEAGGAPDVRIPRMFSLRELMQRSLIVPSGLDTLSVEPVADAATKPVVSSELRIQDAGSTPAISTNIDYYRYHYRVGNGPFGEGLAEFYAARSGVIPREGFSK